MDTEDEREKQEKKGKGEAAGAMGQSRGVVSPAFFEKMAHFGLSMEQITRILREWSHLSGSDLLKRIVDFSRDVARASAHACVQFEKGKDFALITNLLRFFGVQNEAALKNKPSADEQPKPGLGN